MNNNDKFNDILNECLDRMLKGETVEQCLRSHPEQVRELEPLLRTAQIAKQASAIQPRAEFKARARYEFQSALRDMQSKKNRQRTPWFQWHWRWQSGWAIALVAIMVVVLSGGGTVLAAENSMPDDTLYPVKLATEQVQLALTFSDVSKAELNAKLADKRVDEIVNMAAKGDTEKVIVAAQNLNSNLQNLSNLAGEETAYDSTMATGATGADPSVNSLPEQQPMMAGSAPNTTAVPQPAAAPPVSAAPEMATAPTTSTAPSVPAAVMAPPPASTQSPLAQSGNSLVGADGRQIIPAAGATNVPQKPVFQWSEVKGADSYEIELADNPIFVNPLDKQSGIKSTIWPETKTLGYGKTYYWRVRAISDVGNASDWVAQAFTVMPKAPAPVVPTVTMNVPTQPQPTFNVNVPARTTPASSTATDSAGTFSVQSAPAQESTNSQNKSAWNPANRNTNTRTYNNNVQNADKEKIRQIIISNALANQAKLEQALSHAPAQVRPALKQAITQAQAEVDKALNKLDLLGGPGN